MIKDIECPGCKAGWHRFKRYDGHYFHINPTAQHGLDTACGNQMEWFEGKTEIVKPDPIPILLTCPCCVTRHIDEGEFATKPHHTHACQSCGHVWRPALVDTVGVQFLPGFKNE